MKKTALTFLYLFIKSNGYACVTCNKSIQKAIYDERFLPNLVTMLSAFIVLAIIVLVFSLIALKKYRSGREENSPNLNPVPLSNAAIVLGIGIGGFIDGIILHQILQWHEMLSNRIPPSTLLNKSVNMFWDGIFHFFCLIVVCIGIVLLWRITGKKDINRSGKLLGGGLITGWGIFNIVEGVIDHQLLKLHNVRELTPNPEYWNLGFLIISLLMMFLGYFLISKASKNHALNT